jgi:hypothetical protein
MLWMEKEWAQNGIRDNVAKRMLGGIALCTSCLRSKSTGEVVRSNAVAARCCQCYRTSTCRLWFHLSQYEEVCGASPSLTLFTTLTRLSVKVRCVSLRSLVRPLLVGNCRVGHLHVVLAALTTRLRDFSELQQLNHQPRPIAIVNMLILKVRYRLAGRVVPAIIRASHKARNVTPKSPKYDTVLFPFTVCCTLHLKGISRGAFVVSHL